MMPVTLPKDDFGKPFTQGAMVIDVCVGNIFICNVLEFFGSIIDGGPAAGDRRQ